MLKQTRFFTTSQRTEEELEDLRLYLIEVLEDHDIEGFSIENDEDVPATFGLAAVGHRYLSPLEAALLYELSNKHLDRVVVV